MLPFIREQSFTIQSIRFPFNVKKPTGYFIAIIIQCIVAINLNFTVVRTLIFGLGTFLTIFSLVDDMKSDLNSIILLSKSEKNRPELISRFIHLIQFHSNVKQLSVLNTSKLWCFFLLECFK